MTGDPFDLARFVSAQDTGGTYDRAVRELQSGRKVSHWMWFVFPQLAGLGRSATARQYAISSLDEARAYLAHPVLGPRLHEAARAALDSGAPSADDLLGSVDGLKLRSSATLFYLVAERPSEFARLLDRFFDGEPDEATVRLAN